MIIENCFEISKSFANLGLKNSLQIDTFSAVTEEPYSTNVTNACPYNDLTPSNATPTDDTTSTNASSINTETLDDARPTANDKVSSAQSIEAPINSSAEIDNAVVNESFVDDNNASTSDSCTKPISRTWKFFRYFLPSDASQSFTLSNLENITLIWYDPNITQEDRYIKQTMRELRDINDYVILHTDEQECVDYVKSIKDEKIILVISGKNGTAVSTSANVLQQLHSLRQMKSIFILSSTTEEYQHLLENNHKIIGIFREHQDLITAIRENAEQIHRQLEIFSFCCPQRGKATRNLNKEQGEFFWFYLFKIVISNLPHNDQTKQQLVGFCRNYYYGNKSQLKLIDEFEQNYKPEAAIKWYTRDSFLYRLVNKALRTEDIELLHTFRYFISDLSFSLSLACEYQQIKSRENLVMLYRGARLDTEEFENLKANNTNYISLNGFLSTTYSRDIALIYVGTSTTTKHAVLFEIECNAAKLTNRMIFADVSRFSDFPDEEEVLFDLGAAFKILSIKEDKDLNVWIVKMEANDEIAQFGKLYFENIISHGDDATVAIMFGILVNRMGKHDFSFRYFQCLLDNPEGEDLALIYNEMGTAWQAKGDINKAFECYERSYELMMNSTPPRVKDSVRPLHNMANIFSNRKQYDKALLLLFHVLEIDKKYHGEEYLNSAKTLDAIGVLCFNNQAYKNALFYFEKSLEIRKKHLSNTHLEVAGSLQRIGGVYEQMNERKRAFQFYTEALLIRRRLLPDWHANVRESFMSSWNIIFYDEDYLHNMIERLVTGVRNAIMNEDSVDDTPTNDRDHITRTWLDKYSDDTESYYHFLNMVFE